MTIFGIRILFESSYQAELIRAHREEVEAHQAHVRVLERNMGELKMQRSWWRDRFDALRTRVVEIHPRRNCFHTIQVGRTTIRIGPHPVWGLEYEVGVDPNADPPPIPWEGPPLSGPNDARRDRLAAAFREGKP